ncbi:50S ribosomal protein L23 [Gammaproteobacteria bacterium]|nr:50S ribosomal protein L23 [Gammaproteobacteria bacterium]
MNPERIYQILLSPHISEKAYGLTETQQTVVFRVRMDANKPEIKQAVEQLLESKVEAVRTLVVKGKTKRFGRLNGRRKDYKKAYVTLTEPVDLEMLNAAQA